jgi:stearoyl-CoA desaturase (delta-9 desaturase)
VAVVFGLPDRRAGTLGRMKSKDALDGIRWGQNIPFWIVHIAAIGGVIWLGWSWTGFALAMAIYAPRMFAITAGYHRYFSHRSYKMSRPVAFLVGLVGVTSTQKGPLWWASHHRRHHKYSDQPEDIHSPRQRGFLWSHMLWILVKRHAGADLSNVKDLSKYPEIRWLEKNERWIVLGFVGLIGLIWGTWGLIWGYCVSTTILWHCTFCINSATHLWGKRIYETTDDSKNSFLFGLICFGEGWHNNHHYYQRAANQGWHWWQVDISFYGLWIMEKVGLVTEMHRVPPHIRDKTEAPGRARLANEPDDEPMRIAA